MSLLKKVFRFTLLRKGPRFINCFNLNLARFGSWLEGNELIISRFVEFNVPVRCDGLGSVTLYERASLGYRKAPRICFGGILLQARTIHSWISIGSGTSTSNNISIITSSSIKIGENCLIGDQVSIFDSDFHETSPANRHTGQGETSPVVIGDNVWLGSRVQVLKGVNIGEGSVIAAGAIVTRDIPANVITGGVPARIISSIA